MESPQMMETGRQLPAAAVKTNRIVWGAMILGELAFAAVIVIQQIQGNKPQGNFPLNVMIPIDAGMLAIAIAVGWIAPKLIYRFTASDEKALQQQAAMANIIPMAFFESAAFLGLMLVMTSHDWLHAGIVPVLAIVLQLLRFPRATIKA